MPTIKISEREKMLIMVAGGLLLFYLAFILYLSPRWDEIGKIRDRLSTTQLELKQDEAKIKILEKSTGPRALVVKNGQSEEEKALDAFKSISGATASSGLNMESIKPLPQKERDHFRFNLSCGGSFAELHDFTILISRLPSLVLIDDMRVTGGGTANPILTIQMDLSAFY